LRNLSRNEVIRNSYMETIITVLMLFVVLNCAMRLSLWKWWQRIVFSAVLAAFVFWSQKYAVLQSKTQMADYLQNTVALQNMAVIVTIESAANFGFCACWFSDAYIGGKARWWQTLLKWYPSLLVFPVMFYVLTQTMFTAIGVDFGVTSTAVAAATLILLPLLAEGLKWMVADSDGRVEIHVLLSCMVCVLGLISTVTGKMVYHANEAPIDWQIVSLVMAIFIALFAVGFIASRLKWKLKSK